MFEQPRYDPLEPNPYFADGMSARPVVEGTVARGHVRDDEHLYNGTTDGQLAETFPFAISEQDLQRGRQRFAIFCSPCHGLLGDGDGMIVRRGFTQPPSFHISRLREARPGHFYQVITAGWGAMYSYRDRITPEDRWRIVAYVRALQLSQNVAVDTLSSEERQELIAEPSRAGEATREATP